MLPSLRARPEIVERQTENEGVGIDANRERQLSKSSNAWFMLHSPLRQTSHPITSSLWRAVPHHSAVHQRLNHA